MQRRAIRHAVVVLLFAVALGAGAFAWSVDQQLRAITRAEHAAAARFDTLVQAIARFDAAQQLFDVSRESETEWFARVRRLLGQIQSDAAGLHGSTVSAAAAGTFDDVAERVAAAVAKAEENLRAGHDLMATDLVQDEARPGAEAMRAALLEWRGAEAGASDAARSARLQQLWATLGGTAAVWAVGVLLLARRPAAEPVAASTMSILAEPAGEASITEPPPALAPAPAPPPAPAPVDLVPAADLCAEIAQADSGDAVAALLARAAGVVGATGAVLWLAEGGTALIPAMAYGYGPHAHQMLGTLPLADDNLTTRAWHTGQLQGVDGEGRGRGAIAAPMFQGPRRTGVFTVELADNTSAGPLERALTGILAAQFAAAVSPPQAAAAVTGEPPLEATGS